MPIHACMLFMNFLISGIIFQIWWHLCGQSCRTRQDTGNCGCYHRCWGPVILFCKLILNQVWIINDIIDIFPPWPCFLPSSKKKKKIVSFFFFSSKQTAVWKLCYQIAVITDNIIDQVAICPILYNHQLSSIGMIHILVTALGIIYEI